MVCAQAQEKAQEEVHVFLVLGFILWGGDKLGVRFAAALSGGIICGLPTISIATER
jgi:hypothetical protein